MSLLQLKDVLRQFDMVWVNFELRYAAIAAPSTTAPDFKCFHCVCSYVSLMCNVMSEELYYYQQDTIVLFSEATLRQAHTHLS